LQVDRVKRAVLGTDEDEIAIGAGGVVDEPAGRVGPRGLSSPDVDRMEDAVVIARDAEPLMDDRLDERAHLARLLPLPRGLEDERSAVLRLVEGDRGVGVSGAPRSAL